MFEREIGNLNLHASIQPLEAEKSVEFEIGMFDKISISKSVPEKQQIHSDNIDDLIPFLSKFVKNFGGKKLVVWMQNYKDLIFEVENLSILDVIKILKYDKDTILIADIDLDNWLLFDINSDAEKEHKFELTAKTFDKTPMAT